MDTDLIRPFVSVIVPVFNAEKYLEQCILSILQQNLKEIEVIAVNDGSTDNSAEILDKIAKQDSRLCVYHCDNKGVSAARNFGLNNARGTYLGFVDADDWIEPDMFEKMYKAAVQNSSDWVICNILLHHNNGHSHSRLKIKSDTFQIDDSKPKYIERLMCFDYDFANWNKLFLAKLIIDNRLEFNEDIFLAEDLLFNLVYLHHAHKITLLEENLYHYRVVSTSISNNSKKFLVDQNNKLFTSYLSFAKKRIPINEIQAFKIQMARRCYHYLLNEIFLYANETTNNIYSFLAKCHKEISSIDSDIFYFPNNLKFEYQSLKKYLLMKRCLIPFVFLSFIPYKLNSLFK